MVDVCLAGTGGMMPLPDRALTCLWVEYNGHAALIDCGEGTQVALGKAGVKLSRLELMLITHIHGDHILGLPGLLLTLSNCGKTTPLTICGPKGMMYAINGICCICPMLPFPVEVIEFDKQENEYHWLDFTIHTLKMRHTMPCLGYRLRLNRLPVFDPEKAKALKIPTPYWQRLHRGEDVVIDGVIYRAADVVKQEREPTVICYMTDTVSFPEMAEFAENADLFVCEGMYGDLEKVDRMMAKGHTVFAQAAGLAQKANARRLWLTHYSPALQDPHEFEDSVKAIFPNTTVCDDGEKITL